MAHLAPTIRSAAASDNGRGQDFEILYRRHFRLLVSMYRARGMESATAEDLAQETLVRAYTSLGRFDPSRPMWPWVRAIGRRVAAEHWRSPNREVPAELGDGPGIPSEAARVDERGILDLARTRLTRRQDLAVRLRYEEDHQPRQAAAALGVSVAAFNQLLFRARQRLREEYRRLSEGAPVLVWLRWTRARWQSFRRRLHGGISAASGRAGEAADRIIGVGALSVCLVLIPLSPSDEAPAVAGPRPAVEPPRVAQQLTLERSSPPLIPPRGGVDEPGAPGGEPAGEEAGGETAPPTPGSPPPSIPDPGEPPPTEPALADQDLVDTEPDPDDVVEGVLSNPAMKGDPEDPIDAEGIELP